MSDVISDDFDNEEISVVVEGLLPHKTLVKAKEKAVEQFFNLMYLKYGGVK